MAKAKGSGSKPGTSKVNALSQEQPTATGAVAKPNEAAAQQAVVTTEERYRLIAEAAYFRAEARGFQGGDPVADWLEAEAEINRWLMPQHYDASEPREESQDFARTQAPSVQGSNRPRAQ
jgi:hypothetical protein